MTSLASYNKAQLIELVESYRAQRDENEAKLARQEKVVSDLTQANEMLSSVVEDAAQPADAGTPGDMMVTGLLKACVPATRKDGSPVDGLFKYAVELSVSYTTGQDADGNYAWDRVSAYKTLWFTCDEAMASTLTELLEANDWTLVRSWYRYGTKAANVVSTKVIGDDGQQVVGKNGQPVFAKRLKYAADLRGQQVDVIKFSAKADDDANTPDVDENDV